MEEAAKVNIANDYCFCCLSSKNENKTFTVKLDTLKAIFQVEELNLCYICIKLAQHAESFVRNVQSNQILLETFQDLNESIILTAKFETQSVIDLTNVDLDNITLDPNENDDVCLEEFVTYSSRNRNENIKLEVKTEEVNTFDDLEELINDSEFQESPVKEERYLKDEDKCKDVLNDESDTTESNCDIKNTKRTKRLKVKRKFTKKKKVKIAKGCKLEENDEKSNLERIYLTKEQCIEDKLKLAQERKYIDAEFKCEDCVKGFIYKMRYDKHMEKHSKEMGKFICKICKQRRSTREQLLKHEKNHKIRYRCSQCGHVWSNRHSASGHVAFAHCSTGQRPTYECQHCNKSYSRQISLDKHVKFLHTNPQRVTCEFCGKTYAHKQALKAHTISIHPEQVSYNVKAKKYGCKDCDKAFSAPSLLRNHSIKHSMTKDFYCVECDKSFKSKAILTHHLKTASPHVKYVELPLACSHCEKRFAIRRDHERHINRVHLNIKPFQCDKCDKAYINRWSLNEHTKLAHEGYKRPLKFPCTMCDKVFDRNQILKSHIRTHTGERPYQCSKCPAQFSQASILRTHVKLIHLRLTRDGRPKQMHNKS